MKYPYRFLFCLLLLAASCLLPALSIAQPVDSVIVTGQIRHLSARLYREASTILISRNNILQASRELVRPAALNANGTFRVSLPLIYPYEEMYFNYGQISTAFLASAGTVTIEMDADSLFTSAVPFRFKGVNAQVNQQFARYKAFEATYPIKPDGKKLSDQVATMSNETAFRTVLSAYQAAYQAFKAREAPFPLLNRWVGNTNRYNAAAFIYDKADFEHETLPKSLSDSLRPVTDRLLSAARASAMNRFANYATHLVSTEVNKASGLTVRALAILLERYGKNLTADERIRLNDYAMANSARPSDLRFFDGLIKRSPDTLQRLVSYETFIQRSIRQFDSTGVDYLSAYWLTNSLPSLTLNFAHLLYDYARPQVKDPALGHSLDELYRLEVKDSTRIRQGIQTLRKAGFEANEVEIASGIFVTHSDVTSGSSLLDRVIDANRGKAIYLLLTSSGDEAARQAAIDAQRIRTIYSPRDIAIIYVPMHETDKSLWPEMAIRYNLEGDHLLLNNTQLYDVLDRYRPNEDLSAIVLNRTGKVVKRNAPLPGALQELQKVMDKAL